MSWLFPTLNRISPVRLEPAREQHYIPSPGGYGISRSRWEAPPRTLQLHQLLFRSELQLVSRGAHLYAYRVLVPEPESYDTRKDLGWNTKLASGEQGKTRKSYIAFS